MIVPSVDYHVFVDVDSVGRCGDLHGSVGLEVERERDDKPRRPIGFRMPEKAPDPSWMHSVNA